MILCLQILYVNAISSYSLILFNLDRFLDRSYFLKKLFQFLDKDSTSTVQIVRMVLTCSNYLTIYSLCFPPWDLSVVGIDLFSILLPENFQLISEWLIILHLAQKLCQCPSLDFYILRRGHNFGWVYQSQRIAYISLTIIS